MSMFATQSAVSLVRIQYLFLLSLLFTIFASDTMILCIGAWDSLKDNAVRIASFVCVRLHVCQNNQLRPKLVRILVSFIIRVQLCKTFVCYLCSYYAVNN